MQSRICTPPRWPAICAAVALLALPAYVQAAEAPSEPAAAIALPPVEPAAVPGSSLRILRLTDALQVALANQPQLRMTRAATTAAKSRAAQVHTGLLPVISATAQYQRTTGNFAPRPGTVVPAKSTVSLAPSFDLFNVGVQASQLVYDFGQTADREAAASQAADALQANEKTTELLVIAAARRAYFQARAQMALLAVAHETLANHRRHVRQIEGFVAAGTRPEFDLVQVRTNVSNAEVGVIAAQTAYDLGRAQLNQALGVLGDVDFDVGDDEQPPVPGEDGPQQALVDQAIANRPELLALERQRKQQELALRALHSSLWPVVAVTAAATEAGVAVGGLVPNWNVGATLNWALFQGGMNKAQVAEANANLAGLEGQNKLQLLQIQSDIAQARLAVRAAKATIVAAEDAQNNAKELLRLAEARYRAGLGNGIELNDAQLAFTNAAVQVIAARYNLSTARAQLLLSLGQP